MKRKEILSVARKFFSIHGYFGCTMQLIADTVGINKATLYHYYRSKQDLYLDVFDLEMRSLAEFFILRPDNQAKASLRSAIYDVTFRLISECTLDQIMFIKGAQNLLAGNTGRDFVIILFEHLLKYNSIIYDGLKHLLVLQGFTGEEEWTTVFCASYYVFLNGFFDWMLLNSCTVRCDVSERLEILFDVFWNGCDGLSSSAH